MFSKQVVTDQGCKKWVHTSYLNLNKVREMVTHLGTHLFLKDNAPVCTMLLKCVGNHKDFVYFKSVRIVKI